MTNVFLKFHRTDPAAWPHGIYVWHRGKLWDAPLQSDVVIL
jgi:hypothetical protein